jgi:hypothetical protein
MDARYGVALAMRHDEGQGDPHSPQWWSQFTAGRMSREGMKMMLSAGAYSLTRYMMTAGPNEPNTFTMEAKETIQDRESSVPRMGGSVQPYVDVVARHDEWELNRWLPFLWGYSHTIFMGDVLPLRCRVTWLVLREIARLFCQGHEFDETWLQNATDAVEEMASIFDEDELEAWHLKVPLAVLRFEIECINCRCTAASTAVPGTDHSARGEKYSRERSLQWLVDEMCNAERLRNKAKKELANMRQPQPWDTNAWSRWLAANVQREAPSPPTHLDVKVWGLPSVLRVELVAPLFRRV